MKYTFTAHLTTEFLELLKRHNIINITQYSHSTGHKAELTNKNKSAQICPILVPASG